MCMCRYEWTDMDAKTDDYDNNQFDSEDDSTVASVQVCVYFNKYACISINVYVCIYVCICKNMYVCMCMYAPPCRKMKSPNCVTWKLNQHFNGSLHTNSYSSLCMCVF